MTLSLSKPSAAFRKQVLALVGESYGDKTLILCPTMFVKLLKGDHKAAILLNQILYWADRTKDPEGWFYKSYAEWQLETGLSETQVRRIVNGDARVQSAQVTLRDLGVETKLQKVKRTGAPTLHYRVNQAKFIAVLHAFMGQGDSQHCEGSIPDKAQDEIPASMGMNADQSAASLISTETTNPKISAEEYDHQNPTNQPDEDSDLEVFFSFENRFGKFKDRFHETFRVELTRLGTGRIGEVLDRCATRGRSWNYVQRALVNEVVTSELQEPITDAHCGGLPAFNDDEGQILQLAPAEALVAVSGRLQILWRNGADTQSTIRDAWNAVLHQLEAQLDQASFSTYLRDATLVDFDPESQTFVVVVRTTYARDFLQGRLTRMVKRILGDVYGQPAEVKYLLNENWREEMEKSAVA